MKDPFVRTVYQAGDSVPGMNTDIDPSALRDDEFQVMSNTTASRGGIRIRGGIDDKGASGLVSGTLRGSLTGYTNGTFRQLVAQDNATSTRLYYGSDTAFSEFSASSGKYGSTRLATGSKVVFSIVKDTTNSALAPFSGKSGRDLVVASDGATVVVWDPVDNECATHEKVTPPSFGNATQLATWPDYIDCAASNIASHPETGGVTADPNQTYSTYGTAMRLRFAVGTVAGDTGEFRFTTGDTLASGKQLKIAFACSDTEIWKKLKVYIYDGSDRTVYSPSTDDKPQEIEADSTKDISIAVFPIDHNAVPTGGTHTRFKVEWVGDSPAAQTDLYIFGLYGGGVMPGGIVFTETRINSGSRSESGGTVCSGDPAAASARFLGLQDRKNDFEIPISEDVAYAYTLTSDQPSDTDRDKGVDYLLVYALYPDSSETVHVHSEQLCAYAAGWSHSGSRSQNQKFSFTVNSETIGIRLAPDRNSRPCMPHKCSVFSGSRLFIGAVKSADGAGQNTDVYFSRREMPFRFREAVEFLEGGVPDPLSAGRIVIPGEQPKSLATLASSSIGGEPVLIHTEQSFWVIDGPDAYNLSRARRVAPHGTLSPNSVVTYMDSVYWLDQDKNFRVYDGSTRSLSRDVYSNPLEAIPDAYVENAASFVFRNRVFMGYTIGGGTLNTALMVFDIVTGKFYRWVSNLAGVSYHAFHAKGDQLRFWTNGGVLYEHDSSQTDDEGTAIPLVLTPRELHDDMWTECEFTDVGILCDDMASKTLTVTWTGRKSSATSTASKSIDVSSGMAYKWVEGTIGSPFGIDDVSASPSISGNVLGGKKILAIVAKVRSKEEKAS